MRAETTGAAGVRLNLRVAGPADAPPIVLLHGWAQSARCWDTQFADELLTSRFRLIAADLRGHGESDVPVDGYDDPAVWAADLAAVLAYAGAPAVVVGWSYGGLVITDHVRVNGTAGIAGIVLTGAITEIGRGNPGGTVGPAMRTALPAALSADPAVAVPALTAFGTGMSATELPGPTAQALLGASLATPPSVRAALFARKIGSAEVLAGIDVPVLVTHGTADLVVDPAASEYAAGKIPGALTRWFEGVGHVPHVEAGGEFDTELARFATGRAEEAALGKVVR